MLRQLPPTIKADATPDWLPVGWIAHSKVLKRGRQTRTYTQLRTGKKFSTKDHVLEYIKMEKIREKKEAGSERKKASVKAFQDKETTIQRPSWLPDEMKTESRIGSVGGNPYKVQSFQDKETTIGRPSWLPDERKAESRIGSVGGNPYKMNVNTSNDFKTNSKETEVLYENTVKSEDLSGEEYNTGCNEIMYVIEEDEEDFSESEYVKNVENFSNTTSTPLLSQPGRMDKLESPAKLQCVFKDDDMRSDSDNKLPEAKTAKEENTWEKAHVVSNLVESVEEKNLHGVVVECDDDKPREIPGLTGSLTVEINMYCEPASDSLVEKNWNKSVVEGIGTRNIENIDLESDLIHKSGSSEVVEVTQESGYTSEGPLNAQAAQEEIANESRSVFFPYREPPSHSVLVFDSSNARSSAEDLSNPFELGLNPQEKNSSGSKKRKKNTETCSSKNINKKGIEDLSNTIELGLNPQEKNTSGSKERKRKTKTCSSKNIKKKGIEGPTKKIQKGKKTPPSKLHGKKGSSSVVMDKKHDDWPEPCPNFPFEPLTGSFQLEDDSVIRRYLEQHFAAPGNADSNLPLPDFGLPSFSNIKTSLNEEPASKKKKSPDPPCVQVASSSLPSCSSIGTSMLQTVAGN